MQRFSMELKIVNGMSGSWASLLMVGAEASLEVVMLRFVLAAETVLISFSPDVSIVNHRWLMFEQRVPGWKTLPMLNIHVDCGVAGTTC